PRSRIARGIVGAKHSAERAVGVLRGGPRGVLACHGAPLPIERGHVYATERIRHGRGEDRVGTNIVAESRGGGELRRSPVPVAGDRGPRFIDALRFDDTS